MLIRLKAATMVSPPPAYSLERRWQRWKAQSRKELIRTVRQYGYETPDEALAGNVEEDLFDAGWHFPVPAEELAVQMRDLNQRSHQGDISPERAFWLDRPSAHDEEMSDDEDADSGVGEIECVCGQDPCECPDEGEEDDTGAEVSHAVAATRELLNRIRNTRQEG